ncbi:MAG: chloride channel protein [Bacteroidales bacterium]|nr:chloride channel protein [Bacteroidales bacterium]
MAKKSFSERMERFTEWRKAHLTNQQFMLLLSVPTGFLGGLAAILIKTSTHGIRSLLLSIKFEHSDILYFIYPAIGILLTLCFCKFILRKEIGHGIPGILYAIKKKKGEVSQHSMWSTIVASALTVGFGGSVGLEGPSVSTGASIGANLARWLKLEYKQVVMLIGMGGAAALASIFQAPMTGIFFALEVLMIDLSLGSLIPIICASFTAILTSYFFLGQAVEYTAIINEGFIPANALYYIGLGIFVGFISAYFLRVTFSMEKRFKRIGSPWTRFLIGATLLGILIFLFPALYGEGYDAINSALKGDYSSIYGSTLFEGLKGHDWSILVLLAAIILLKAFATALTFGAGGVGGTFAPALFIGAFSGLLFALTVNYLGGDLDPAKFALVGMSGLIAGMLHAPLTGIFLIAEITDGYKLIVPLMIVSALSYFVNRIFFKHSVYTNAVAEHGVEVTHNKDVSILTMMTINGLIETNFSKVKRGSTLGDLIPIISSSRRNIFPVVDKDGTFCGHVLFDDIRSVMFDQTLYDHPIEEFTVIPEYLIQPEDPMETIVKKFQVSGKYNIPVIENGKYLGYISRANVFSTYRKTLSDISED